MDRCTSIRHASRCRKWQCTRSQQVGSHVGRGCVTVEELDFEPIDGRQYGWVILSNRKVHKWRVVHARYGLRGVRVGEASHSGPPLICRHRRRRDVVFEISSDEDPLVRGIATNVVHELTDWSL